jgi:apoptosis-stimulating of p53 protein 1
MLLHRPSVQELYCKRVVSSLQMIVRVYGDSGGDDEPLVTDVPVTPDTTCRDVVECCRDPGEEICALVETWGSGNGE